MYTQFHTDYQHSQAESPTPVAHDTHQPHGTDLIGRPILFVSGQFAGQSIRAELREVQQANLGRKYAKVDRRPLDPPPVVHLRLFQVLDAGTDHVVEKEIQDYEDVQVNGLVCTVDLFPVSPVAAGCPSPAGSLQKVPRTPSTAQTSFTSSSTAQFSPESSRQHTFTFIASHTYSTGQSIDDALTPSPTHTASTSAPEYVSRPQVSVAEPLHFVDGFPILESSKMTSSLVGATFVQPAIVEFQGKKSIMFVFADLAVKAEGTFILRYRVFDIFSKPYNYADLVIQAECYGGPFRVYSTKEFPGLQASTDLTKQLARWGVRLNTRETERKRRKKGSVSPQLSPRKRKLPSPMGAGASYESDDE